LIGSLVTLDVSKLAMMDGQITKLDRWWRGFRDASGSTTVMFALATLPVFAVIGVAVDYSRASSMRIAMQAAVDTTALAIAPNAPGQTSDQLNSSAASYFHALFIRPDAQNVQVAANYATGGASVVVNASASVKTMFMSVVGLKNLSISASGTAVWRMSRLRVALVLDNTGSMAGNGKMTALKTAAKNLIAQLQAGAVNTGDVYVSIIPFAKDVNAGATNQVANWINWVPWDAINAVTSGTGIGTGGSGSICWNGQLWTWNGSTSSYGGTCSTGTSTMCYNGTAYAWNGTSFTGGGSCSTGTDTTSSTKANDHSAWNGCITDRDQDYDIKNTPPNSADANLPSSIASTLFPADQDPNCPVQLMPLSADWTALNSKIDAMTPKGNTNQAIGLAWGWQSLTQGDPLHAPAEDPGYQHQKVIILLTDGLNTHNRWTRDRTQIDARQQKLCSNIKAAGITLYTIQVNTSNDPTSTLLQSCASDASKSFVLSKADQIVTTFGQIGTNLAKLHIAK
jgi:Flp pilus assembly protein TadG